ncbi:MAG: N-acetylmuramoyl-L-alanine amidase [Verrucomicrobia bacterium]|nr:N-acetylmuramoyl-L-alanine amidase [Verrucomicrobiota bacterium]
MRRLILLLVLFLWVVAGCRGPRYNAEDQPSTEPTPSVGPASPSGFPAPSEPVVEPAEPASPHLTVPSPWVVVADWARVNRLPNPLRVSQGEQPVFELRSERGAFQFQIGTQQARFEGMSLLLGFEPCVFGGEPCLHALDVERNLAPLMLAPPFNPSRYRLLVIDPGHGGGNTGTRSAQGDLEKDYTLDWALRLRPLLEAAGWTVVLTRTNDTELTLLERVALADAAGADLFISLHFNASGAGNHQAGLETYCLTPQGMPSSLTRGFEDDPNIEYPNNTFDTENLQLAVRIHQALLAVNGGEDRGVRRARFMGVLRGQDRPAVLVEGGFLSNPQEAARIADPGFRQELAEALAAAFVADADQTGSPR